MLRSAWEDTNDMRRKSYAGGKSYKLDTREDFDNPRLLSPEEEQKIRAVRHKGKCKGKGKGTTTQTTTVVATRSPKILEPGRQRWQGQAVVEFL